MAAMTLRFRNDYVGAVREQYQAASKALKSRILDELCQVCGYHRTYAITKLTGEAPGPRPRATRRRARGRRSGPDVLAVVEAIWEAAGIPGRCG